MKTLATLFCGLALLPGILVAQQQEEPKAPKFVPALGWDRSVQGPFVTSVIADAQNAIWAGTEGRGLWRYDPRGKKWAQFTTKDGLGDDSIYALAADRQGRIWAGHLNHGVSVWNGEKWKNYGLLDGPLGDRVFAIATCPTDGDVWIATDCGVARYSQKNDDWDYFTRASGLPSDQIQAVAFDALGNIYLGTQCDGIAMADAKDNYKKWSFARALPETPVTSGGPGLATDLINYIALVTPPQNVARPGETERIITATPLGISASIDKGDHFNFLRGDDWQANASGLANAPAPGQPAVNAFPVPQNVQIIQGGQGGVLIINGNMVNGGNVNIAAPQKNLLTEDWVTTVKSEKETGFLWTGYRQKGMEIRNYGTTNSVRVDTEGSDALTVRSIWLGPKAPPLVAIYDALKGGLATLDSTTVELEAGDPAPKTPPALPAVAKPPQADSMQPIIKHLAVYENKIQPGEAVYLGDDWRTGGDWVGHYGKSFARVCASGTEGVFMTEQGFYLNPGTGPHKNEKDKETFNMVDTRLTDKSTENPRALYNPRFGARVEGDMNDGSMALDKYPLSWEGPDLSLTVDVPTGIHCLSLYFSNDEAHTAGLGKMRDYEVQLLKGDDGTEEKPKGMLLARARATDFWGGVYKQFVIVGPSKYIVRIARNRSYGTVLQGLFIDRITEDEVDEKKPAKKMPLPGFDNVKYDMPEPPEEQKEEDGKTAPDLVAADALWTQLDMTFDKRGAVALQNPLRLWAYRAAVAAKADEALLANWRWQMTIWTPGDRAAFQKAMEAGFKAWSEKYPQAKPETKPSN